jgi:hypothetical protein
VKWWLRSRRWRRIAAVLALYPVGILTLADVALPWPGLGGTGSLAVPVALLLPLAVVAALGDGLASGESALERAATRPVALMDAVLVLSSAGIVALASLSLSLLVGFELAESSARNAVGLTGIFLFARSFLGTQVAPAIPAGYAAVAMLIGRQQGQAVEPWAWAVSRDASTDTWAWAASFAVGGLIVALRPIHRLGESC